MEATCSSETSVVYQRTTRRYIPEDITLYNHRFENFTAYKTHDIRAYETVSLNSNIRCGILYTLSYAR
jgi:hypothetical protein